MFADWLETRGDPRGQCIQLEARLAAIAADDPDRPALAAQLQRLVDDHTGLDLIRGVPRCPRGSSCRRGFVVAMTGRFPAATLRGSELAAAAPLLIRAVLSIDGQADRVELSRPRDTAALERLRELTISGRHPGVTRGGRGPIAQPAALAAVPWRALRCLELARLRLPIDGLRAWLASPHLKALEHLALRLRLTSAELVAVLRDLVLPALRTLDVTRNRLDAGFVAVLARAPIAATLTDLTVSAYAAYAPRLPSPSCARRCRASRSPRSRYGALSSVRITSSVSSSTWRARWTMRPSRSITISAGSAVAPTWSANASSGSSAMS